MKSGVLLVVVLILSGCFLLDSTFRNAPRAQEGDATVYLFRPSIEARAKKEAWFFIDDVPVANLSRNSHTWIHIPAGKHTLRQQWSKNSNSTDAQTSISVNWQPGKQYYHVLSLSKSNNKNSWYLASSRRDAILSRLIDSKFIASSNIRKLRR